jgi:carbon starvation protein
MSLHAMPVMLGVLAILAIAYRYYSAFLAARVAVLDDKRETPAHRFRDGQNFDPTNRWVLFGHHFAAIAGAGPLIGPVLAIQFGYLPGLIWLVVGVCLAGAVQDMMVLALSTQRGGRSLASLARQEIGRPAGIAATIAILYIIIMTLAGLGIVVVKALGGEEVPLKAGTVLVYPEGSSISISMKKGGPRIYDVPAQSTYRFGEAAEQAMLFHEPFRLAVPSGSTLKLDSQGKGFVLPENARRLVPGSSWGTFTIACTIPIALFVGWYMYRLRKGKVVEASIIGGVAVLGATVAGALVPGSPLEPSFSLSRDGAVFALAAYGFVAAVLPVWLLLCPRDYLSSFLKIGTIFLLVIGVIAANPKLEAPMISPYFARGGGPYFDGPIFPYVFICIMCGAISGFHSLVSSGTTPKMVSKESDIRMIGYGAMLMEGLVGVVALIAAAALPNAMYYDINIDLGKRPTFMAKNPDFAQFLKVSEVDPHGGHGAGDGAAAAPGSELVAMGAGRAGVAPRADGRSRDPGGGHGPDLLERSSRRALADRVLVSLRDHVRGPVHPDDDRRGNADCAVPGPGVPGPLVEAAGESGLAAGRDAGDGPGGLRLGLLHLDRFGRDDLADVRHGQSAPGRDRARGGHDGARERRPRPLRGGDAAAPGLRRDHHVHDRLLRDYRQVLEHGQGGPGRGHSGLAQHRTDAHAAGLRGRDLGHGDAAVDFRAAAETDEQAG